MADKTRIITSCRICGSKNLIPILSLGEQYVSNFVDFPTKEKLVVPLDLVLCDANSGGCGLLQLKHTASPETMYRNYWYKSGMNQTMKDALADITAKAKKLVKLVPGDVVIDIGCNDGTLLRSYGLSDITLVGFEPAMNLVDEAGIGATKIINDFFNVRSFHNNFAGKKAKIITSIAMFYDLDEPNVFVSDIAACLDKDGVWIVQMSYLPLMLETNAFDNICHEHLEYYSLLSLENLLKRHNLEVFDVELNDVNGGSFRVYIKHAGSGKINAAPGAGERLAKQHEYESKLGLNNKKIYEEFSLRVKSIKDELIEFIKAEAAKGKKIYIYGASTKGNTLLQYCGLDASLIKAAAERNPYKWGKKTVGTLIPIISEEQARSEKPDYFLVLPWHFLKEFISREAGYLKNGGKFIVPLPEFKIIDAEALEK